MLTVWVDEHEGAHKPARSGNRSWPARQGSEARSHRLDHPQRKGAERRWSVRSRTLDRKTALGPPPHSDVWFREPTN